MIPLIFFGTPDFAVYTLKALLASDQCCVKLVVTQPDKPAGRGGKLRPPPVKELAQAHSIPVLQPASIRKEQEIFLKSAILHGPFAMGIVIAFGQILPQAVLDLPQHGCLNLHASLLPRWRGAAPIQRSIMAGDGETGICLMKMEVGLDTGPVYSSISTPIGEDDDAQSLHDRLGQLGADLLLRDLNNIIAGGLKPQPQKTEGIAYASKISAEEARIDWSRSAEEVANIIRGLSPYPGSYTFCRGERLKVLRCAVKKSPRLALDSPIGGIVYLDRGTLEIQCGEGILSLLEVQLEGRKRMPIADFLRGTSLQQGVVLS